MASLLTDVLAKAVEVDGYEYPVRWQFQYGIVIERALHDEALSQDERWWVALSTFYAAQIPENIEAAIARMCAFLVREKPLNRAQKRVAAKQRDTAALFCYQHDDEYIFAAFMQQYGINLAREVDLHWHEFQALLHALDDCPFARVKGWRGADLSKIKGAEARRQAGELKALWALPEPQGQEELVDALEEALMGDGDLRGVLGNH